MSDDPARGGASGDAAPPTPPPARPRSLAAQRAAARTPAERATHGLDPQSGQPISNTAPPVLLTTLTVAPPHPVHAMWLTGWPLAACALLAAFIVGVFFPVMGLPLLMLTPPAVAAAFVVAARRATAIRREINQTQVRVGNDNVGVSCARAAVHLAVRVGEFDRGPLRPRTTDLVLLDRSGRSLLVLSGVLWPPAVLDDVSSVLQPMPVERVSGRQTAATLAARYPRILDPADGRRGRWATGGRGMLVALLLLLAGALVVTARMVFG